MDCWNRRCTCIERFHVTSQSRENHTGGHFGVQLNGDLVCCMMHVQNAVQTWQLMDLPQKYVRYRYPVHVICETWAHWLDSSRLSHISSYLLVHQDGRHAQKYHGVMQTYIIFNHVMKTLYIHTKSVTKFSEWIVLVLHCISKTVNGQSKHTCEWAVEWHWGLSVISYTWCLQLCCSVPGQHTPVAVGDYMWLLVLCSL